LDGALPYQVIIALWSLGRPLREAREALGMTETTFTETYREFICAFGTKAWNGG
jgi:propanediol dehydratase small subunit